jgi:putative ABC transport system permease protein
MIDMALEPAGFAPGEYLSTRFWVESDVDASLDAGTQRAADDSARAIVRELVHRLATEPGVVGVSVTGSEPWAGGRNQVEVDGADAASGKVRTTGVDTGYFSLFGARVLAGRNFAASDAALPEVDRPVIVNRSFATELLGGGDPVGRRVRYQRYGDDVMRWHTIVGVVEDFPASIKSPADGTARTMYNLAMPGEWNNALLTIRLRGQTPEGFAPMLRRVATATDPMLQLSGTTSLYASYREYTLAATRLALVIALITGSVLFLSAAGIHALMQFTVQQRRREIGIRSALGASARSILTSILTRAARQLALGVGIGLATAIALNLLTQGELMGDAGMLLVPATAAFMLVVGLLAAFGPARRGLRVQPTEALRAE